MSKILVLFVFFGVVLAACAPSNSSLDASVPNNPNAKATQAIVQKYIAADQSQSYDPNALVSLYASNATWESRGEMSIPVIDAGGLKDFYTTYWMPPDRQVKFVSYMVTLDGSSAVIQAILSKKSQITNQMVSAPVTITLDFKDGHIERETWYYNADLIR